MVELTTLKTGDTVYWLDEMNDYQAFTYISHIGDIAILSALLERKKYKIEGYPDSLDILVNENIADTFEKMAASNNYINNTYPVAVAFAKAEALYLTANEALDAASDN